MIHFTVYLKVCLSSSPVVFYSPSRSPYIALRDTHQKPILLTFEHLNSLGLGDKMDKLLRLLDMMSRLDLFEALLVTFMLNLCPLFIQQFAGLGLRSVHLN